MMSSRIQFKINEGFVFTVELNTTVAGQNLVKALPCVSTASRWGDEVSCAVSGVQPSGEYATRDVNIGDVTLCASAQRLCVFFGPTPASVLDKPVAQEPVVIIGTTCASADELRRISPGDRVHVSSVAGGQAAAAQPVDPYGERKLSQGEIDNLVQRLLREMEEKKRQIHQQPGM
jgi:hypothetical protein